jgi:hypothetical protein
MRIAAALHSQRRYSTASSFGNCLSGHMDLGLQQGMFTRGFLVFGKDQPSDLVAAHSGVQLQTGNGCQQVK